MCITLLQSVFLRLSLVRIPKLVHQRRCFNNLTNFSNTTYWDGVRGAEEVDILLCYSRDVAHLKQQKENLPTGQFILTLRLHQF